MVVDSRWPGGAEAPCLGALVKHQMRYGDLFPYRLWSPDNEKTFNNGVAEEAQEFPIRAAGCRTSPMGVGMALALSG